MKNNPINRIIAADDLNWNELEGQYTVLSEDEIYNILSIGMSNGIESDSGLHSLISWATNAKVGNLLLKYLLEDKIKVSINESNEPIFAPKSSSI